MQVLVTFLMVDFAWIFFRVEHINDALQIIQRIIWGMDWTFVYTNYLELGLSALDWRVIVFGLLVIMLVDALHYIYKEQFMDMFLHENIGARYLIFIGLFASTVVFGIYGAGFDSASFIYRGF